MSAPGGHRRTRVSTGIYADRYGLAATVSVRGRQREKRFPSDTPLDAVRAWRQRTRGELLIEHAEGRPRPRARDSFAAAARRYVTLLSGRPGAAADASHVGAWVERFGERRRRLITSEDVRLAFAAWRTSGQRRQHQKLARPVSAQTLRHRYRVLKRLYHVLDGPRAPTPCDDVERPVVRRGVPKDVDARCIQLVADRVLDEDAWTFARFLVLATTGKAPAELMRAAPADFDRRRRTWRIVPAKDREPQLLPLNEEMCFALAFLFAIDAHGPYDTTRYARVLRRSGWPEGLRPYNVRHALAIELLRRGADLGDVQAHLGHASVETTRRFYAKILEDRARRTSQRLEGRFRGLLPTRSVESALGDA